MFEGFVLLVGFACGYGLRDYISRRRRAAAREQFEKRALSRQEQIDKIERMTLLVRTSAESQRGESCIDPDVWHRQSSIGIRPKKFPASHH